MKKILSILLTLCMCFSLVAMLASCEGEHEHVFETEWESDETYHWHECEADDCAEVSDKAEHEWDDGKEKDDETVYTCTVCGETKEKSNKNSDKDKKDPEKNDGISEEKWEAAADISKFDNVTIDMSGSFKRTNESDSLFGYIYKLDGEAGEYYCYAEGSFTQEVDPDEPGSLIELDEIQTIKDIFLKTTFAILDDFDNFTYDKDEGVYKSKSAIVYNVTVFEYNAKITAENVIAEFDKDNNITRITCDMTQEYKEYGTDKVLVLSVTFAFSDYKTTTVLATAE